MDRIKAELHRLNEDLRADGSWVFTGGLHAPGSATVVRADGMITDGPYIEGKEHIGGIYVISSPDLDAALGWARKANGGKLLLPVAHDPEYEQFIQETGFDFERDLDAVAFAIHYPEKWAGGGTGGNAPEPRFSEVFIGKFDGTRCLAYLKRTAQSVENYNSIDIFTIPLYGRSFRIAILGVDELSEEDKRLPYVQVAGRMSCPWWPKPPGHCPAWKSRVSQKLSCQG